MCYERQIKHTLRMMGIIKPSKGYLAMIPAVKLAMEEPSRLSYITKEIYVNVAHAQKTSPLCVERNIRTLIDLIWGREDHEYLNKIFEITLEEKPTNKEFITALVNYLSEQTEDESR